MMVIEVTTAASSGHVALRSGASEGLVANRILSLADYNLPHGLDGVRASILLLREAMHRAIPSLVLTGDTSAGALERDRAWRTIASTLPSR